MPSNVLVTGGTGSFGKAFVRFLLDFDAPASIRVLSRDEAKQAEMRSQFNDPRLRFLVGDVRDRDRMADACRGVDTVIHAAAMKRVETCEADPWEAVRTNVHGTENVMRASLAAGVRRAVLLSTDKAVAPNTLYGFTKATAERLWVAGNVYAAGTGTRFSATRYGNVLGSTGSVVPVWRAQAATGAVQVTEPSMTRFWMRMEHAVDLVWNAVLTMRGGEVFIPKIGASTITTLAQAIAPECRLEITGIRPGEKMHEALIGPDEVRHTFDAGGYYIVEPTTATWDHRPPLPHPQVGADFEYRSDTTRTLCTEELREMVA